jgi:hypothetical protein
MWAAQSVNCRPSIANGAATAIVGSTANTTITTGTGLRSIDRRVSDAPMMDWTDDL